MVQPPSRWGSSRADMQVACSSRAKSGLAGRQRRKKPFARAETVGESEEEDKDGEESTSEKMGRGEPHEAARSALPCTSACALG
eukprot:3847796-Rhodomonas_salina.11